MEMEGEMIKGNVLRGGGREDREGMEEEGQTNEPLILSKRPIFHNVLVGVGEGGGGG